MASLLNSVQMGLAEAEIKDLEIQDSLFRSLIDQSMPTLFKSWPQLLAAYE